MVPVCDGNILVDAEVPTCGLRMEQGRFIVTSVHKNTFSMDLFELSSG
jgi:hypothetical protein